MLNAEQPEKEVVEQQPWPVKPCWQFAAPSVHAPHRTCGKIRQACKERLVLEGPWNQDAIRQWGNNDLVPGDSITGSHHRVLLYFRSSQYAQLMQLEIQRLLCDVIGLPDMSVPNA